MPLAEPPQWTDVALIAAAAGAWFVVKYGTVTVALRLRFGGAWSARIQHGLAFELLSTGSLLLLSPILLAAAQVTPALIPLVLVPLYAVYRMARLSTEQDELARLDPLTGLASRKALVAEVTEQVAAHAERAARGDADAAMALLLLDLDRFQHVNDALGHAVGDRLLIEVGRPARRRGARRGRPGGPARRRRVRRARARAARRRPRRATWPAGSPRRWPARSSLDGLPVDVGGSIGIALYPDHGDDFADPAAARRRRHVRREAQRRRGGGLRPESDHHSAERLALLADLRRALETPGCDEIAMYYQPQVDIATGEVVGRRGAAALAAPGARAGRPGAS